MRAWKYLVLIGGIIGIAGFFLPFVEFHNAQTQISGDTVKLKPIAISGYQVVRGIDDLHGLIESTRPLTRQAQPEIQLVVAGFNAQLAQYRGLMIAFYVPALLLALLGALAGLRRKMGRLAGLFAIAFGAGNALVWLVFDQVSRELATKSAAYGTTAKAVMGLGLHALLAAGLLAALAGMGALALPDRGVAD
ncbi:MAG: hypothetical protein HOV81_27030 [Kofleriaceae bacterium]|nr:hypothetical protein [Kofleriaceae bacterium]